MSGLESDETHLIKVLSNKKIVFGGKASLQVFSYDEVFNLSDPKMIDTLA